MNKIKNHYIIILSLSLLAVLSACAGNPKDLDGLINHLSSNGIHGEISEKAYAMIGAINGTGIKGEDVSIEIYEFKSSRF